MIAAILLAAAQAAAPAPALAPSEIVAAAPASDWRDIVADDLMVMELEGGRRITIQLMPPPFSQGWIGNIRKLAAARWWDGTSVNRVQDNYVVQWGDATEKKPLPAGLKTVPESDYQVPPQTYNVPTHSTEYIDWPLDLLAGREPFALTGFFSGWPFGTDGASLWPVHCYGMVGVGRNMSPDTGSGAELYTVIGHAPRHLDRNIALVGRVIDGIEHLSSLPRGTGALGFYEKAEQRVPIVSIRIGGADAGSWQYLDTASQSFARYADARANRRDPFFIRPAGGADVCNIPVPVRRKP